MAGSNGLVANNRSSGSWTPLHGESRLPFSEHGGIFIACGFKCCDFRMAPTPHAALSELCWGWVKGGLELLLHG